MSFNIDRSNTDPFYRYKMPRLIAKVGVFFLQNFMDFFVTYIDGAIIKCMRLF